MKKLLLLVALMIVSNTMFSQLRLGIVGSYGLAISRLQSTMLGTEEGKRAYEVAFLDHKSTPAIGLGFYYEVGNLFFMAEGQYRKEAYRLRVKNYLQIDEPMNYIEESASTVHIPVTGGLKFGSVKLGVGPIFNFQIDRTNLLTTRYAIKDRRRGLQMGFAGLIGLDLNQHFSVFLRYEHTFSRIGDDYRYRGKILPIQSKLDYITFNIAMFI